MAQLSYPGVYVEEIPSGVHTITGVPTSVAAFVGYTARGLENKATQIFSWSDFERNFGGLAIDSELSYAVQGFFANGGGQAFIVRVPKSDAAAAGITVNDGVTPTPSIVTLTAIDSGAWGNNLVADIDYDGASTSTFNLTVTDLGSGASERFAGLSVSPTSPTFAPTLINDPDNGSQLVRISIPAATVARPMRSGTISDVYVWPSTFSGAYYLNIKISKPSVTTPIIAAQDILVTYTTDTPGSLVALARLIQLRLNAALAATPGAAVLCEVTSAGELKFSANFDQSLLPDTLDAVITFGTPSSSPIPALAFTAPPAVSRYRLGTAYTGDGIGSGTLGKDGTKLPGTGLLVGDPAHFTGIYALDKVDFNLLAIPDATRSLPGQPDVPDSTDPITKVDANVIFGAAMTFCQNKRAFLMIDTPPQVNAVEKAVDWRTNGFHVRGNNGAMYFPRLRIPDPLNDYKLRNVAPCGVAAGVYARTDGARGVWKAPAGIDAYLNGVSAPAVILSDSEQGVLNPIGLNCFRAFPVYGNVTWGARTNDGADALGSEWKYVPVRRLALFMEESLYRGTKWAVFEPNDASLWAQLRLNIGAFMNSLFVQGAFQGSSPRDAYLVKCDKETTTQNDINNGVVNILVGFAPLKPAEFVVLQIQQMAGQIQT